MHKEGGTSDCTIQEIALFHTILSSLDEPGSLLDSAEKEILSLIGCIMVDGEKDCDDDEEGCSDSQDEVCCWAKQLTDAGIEVDADDENVEEDCSFLQETQVFRDCDSVLF